MQTTGVLAVLLPDARDTRLLANLVAIENTASEPTDPVRRLAALIANTDSDVVIALADRWHFSAEDGARLTALCDVPAALDVGLDPRGQRALLYRLGAARVRDVMLLTWASQDDIESETAWLAMLKAATKWKPQQFPLAGTDVLVRGIPEGPVVGRLLREVEEWWIERDFVPDRAALLDRLDALVAERRRA